MAAVKKKSMARATAKKQKEKQITASQFGLLWLPVVVFFVLLSCLSVFYIWERLRTKEISRQIVELQRIKQTVLEENSRLLGTAEELGSYHRIYQIATDNFGFVELEPVILVSPGKK